MPIQRFQTDSEQKTQSCGENLAKALYPKQSLFIELKGPLGAGKTAFARGFIRQWLMLSGDPLPESIPSPTYTLAKTYGGKRPLAHLDLYRLESMQELEELGYEHYFFEHDCCLVEWLERLPNTARLRPEHFVVVEITIDEKDSGRRKITVQGL